ncbi:hypothetical protein AKJ09_06735 [Labilithrix luteola]|uniref:Silver efflux pump n=1 Tax=Labilithrix luteola TaxID=1391654 RepID=A0A0K1Q344_9BACT|nr:hypothetical protein AKJ09_06735 [Labilithrix luteola]
MPTEDTMKNVKNMASVSGAIVAGAVASLFAAAPIASAQTPGGKVHCEGINSCKGQGACKSAANDCKGKNGCKGKGFVLTDTEKECLDKGGKPVQPEPKK